jgi:hypothetical protein
MPLTVNVGISRHPGTSSTSQGHPRPGSSFAAKGVGSAQVTFECQQWATVAQRQGINP